MNMEGAIIGMLVAAVVSVMLSVVGVVHEPGVSFVVGGLLGAIGAFVGANW